MRIRGIRVVGLVVAMAAIAPALGCRPPASSSSAATVPIGVLGGGHRSAPGKADGAVPTGAMLREHRGPVGEADGVVPSGTTVFDDEVPAVGNLNPALLGALRQGATNAAEAGVEFLVDSGWRSPEYQEQLLRAAVSKYGFAKEAARWVATPGTSAHVSGNAVDVGPSKATAWLSAHGAAYGLCQIYDNEPWHYELRPEASHSGCPARYADAAHDPRMQH
jgi:D-alanyl-D-alanine carboxypeptidase